MFSMRSILFALIFSASTQAMEVATVASVAVAVTLEALRPADDGEQSWIDTIKLKLGYADEEGEAACENDEQELYAPTSESGRDTLKIINDECLTEQDRAILNNTPEA